MAFSSKKYVRAMLSRARFDAALPLAHQRGLAADKSSPTDLVAFLLDEFERGGTHADSEVAPNPNPIQNLGGTSEIDGCHPLPEPGATQNNQPPDTPAPQEAQPSPNAEGDLASLQALEQTLCSEDSAPLPRARRAGGPPKPTPPKPSPPLPASFFDEETGHLHIPAPDAHMVGLRATLARFKRTGLLETAIKKADERHLLEKGFGPRRPKWKETREDLARITEATLTRYQRQHYDQVTPPPGDRRPFYAIHPFYRSGLVWQPTPEDPYPVIPRPGSWTGRVLICLMTFFDTINPELAGELGHGHNGAAIGSWIQHETAIPPRDQEALTAYFDKRLADWLAVHPSENDPAYQAWLQEQQPTQTEEPQ